MTILTALAFFGIGLVVGLGVAVWVVLHIAKTPGLNKRFLQAAHAGYYDATGDLHCPVCGCFPVTPRKARKDLS